MIAANHSETTDAMIVISLLGEEFYFTSKNDLIGGRLGKDLMLSLELQVWFANARKYFKKFVCPNQRKER